MFTYGSPRGQKKPNRTNLHRRQKPICFLTLTLLRESVLLSGRRGPDRDAPGTGRAVAPPGSARFYPPLSRAEWSRHWGARDVRVLSRVGCYGCWRTLGGEKMSGDSGFGWTVVVLTCQHKDSVYSFQRGEYPRKRSALIERVIIEGDRCVLCTIFFNTLISCCLRAQTSLFGFHVLTVRRVIVESKSKLIVGFIQTTFACKVSLVQYWRTLRRLL